MQPMFQKNMTNIFMATKDLTYFVDSGAFYASKDPSDQNYKLADDFMQEIRRDPLCSLITSNFIIDETITLIRMKLGHSAAVKFGRQIRKSKVIRIIHVTEEIEDRAWKIFEKYTDKDFSFTDCTSFAIMDNKKIKNVFAFDRHFSQYGFLMKPDS